MKTLEQMQEEVYELNLQKGWFDSERAFPEEIALIHSEVSEALEAYREGEMKTYLSTHGKPEGMPSELADIFIRLLDVCHRYSIDLEKEYELKMNFNRCRPYRHGNKVV